MKIEIIYEIGDVFQNKTFLTKMIIVDKNKYFQNKYVDFIIRECLPDGIEYYGVDKDYIEKYLEYKEHIELK
jgi:hypothetical protein